MLIRDADADGDRDAAACATIYAPYVTDTVISLEEQAPTADEFAGRIATTTRTHPWLIAQEADEVIGYAYAARHHGRASYRWATDVAVYVDSAFHRRGIGRSLYTALFELLRRQGFHVACAGVTLPNDASVGLHESLGFIPVGVYRRIGFKFGTWWDVGWWQLELISAGADPPSEPGPPARIDETS